MATLQELQNAKLVTTENLLAVKTYIDNNSYQIKIKVEYQKDLKYPTEIELKLIHKDKKLYIIEVK